MNVENSKNIWIINQYGSTPSTGLGGRHFYFSQELAKQGHNVYEIASTANHLLHTQPSIVKNIDFESISGFTFVWVKMPRYVGAHSKQRVLNWFLFPWRIQKLAKLIKDKPDVILCSSPSPLVFLGAQRLAKRFSSRLVFEVRDIWPLTLTEIGGYSVKHPLVRLMQWVEDKAYRDSDRVVSNLKNSIEHMVQHGLERDKFTWVANGFSLEEVRKKVPLSETLEQQLPKGKFIVGYTGTLGVANSMGTLVDAAEMLRAYTSIVFVLVGNGKEKERLASIVNAKKLQNIIFIEPIPKVQIQAMLSKFDACFIGWIKDDIYRFGIAANKIPEYLYSGKPIVHAYSGACDPVAKYNAGVLAEAENPEQLSDAILRLFQMTKAERKKMGDNGREAALEEYEYGMLAKKMARVLLDD